jgi:hypothetical protein
MELLNKIKVTDIEWDVDNEEDLCDLPIDLEFNFPDSCNIEEDLADAISDAYGFAIKNLSYEIIPEESL